SGPCIGNRCEHGPQVGSGQYVFGIDLEGAQKTIVRVGDINASNTAIECLVGQWTTNNIAKNNVIYFSSATGGPICIQANAGTSSNNLFFGDVISGAVNVSLPDRVLGPGQFGSTLYALSFTRSGGAGAFPDLYGDGTNALVLAGKNDGSGTVTTGTTTALQVPASLALGGGTALTKAVVYSQSLTPSAVGAATVVEQSFTVTGVSTADKIVMNPPTQSTAVAPAYAYVSASNTVKIGFVNPTAGSLTPSSGTYLFIAFRS